MPKLTAKLEVAEGETKVRQDPADEKADMCSLRIVIIRYFSQYLFRGPPFFWATRSSRVGPISKTSMMLLFMPSDCLIVSSHFDKVISFAAAASHPGISNLSCLGGRAYSKILPLSIHPDL